MRQKLSRLGQCETLTALPPKWRVADRVTWQAPSPCLISLIKFCPLVQVMFLSAWQETLDQICGGKSEWMGAWDKFQSPKWRQCPESWLKLNWPHNFYLQKPERRSNWGGSSWKFWKFPNPAPFKLPSLIQWILFKMALKIKRQLMWNTLMVISSFNFQNLGIFMHFLSPFTMELPLVSSNLKV